MIFQLNTKKRNVYEAQKKEKRGEAAARDALALMVSFLCTGQASVHIGS
jgi:hypothetical protein